MKKFINKYRFSSLKNELVNLNENVKLNSSLAAIKKGDNTVVRSYFDSFDDKKKRTNVKVKWLLRWLLTISIILFVILLSVFIGIGISEGISGVDSSEISTYYYGPLKEPVTSKDWEDIIVTSIVKSVSYLVWILLVIPITFIMNILQWFIFFISGGKLLNDLLFTGSGDITSIIIVMAGIGAVLLLLFGVYKLSLIFMSKSPEKDLKSLGKYIVVGVSSLILIPFAFFVSNLMVTLFVNLLLGTETPNKMLSFTLYQDSWKTMAQGQAQNSIPMSPPESDNFQIGIYLILLVGAMILLGYIAIGLGMRMWELVALYLVGFTLALYQPIDSGKNFKWWIGTSIQKFGSLVLIIVPLTAFFTLSPVINELFLKIQSDFDYLGIASGLLIISLLSTMVALPKYLSQVINDRNIKNSSVANYLTVNKNITPASSPYRKVKSTTKTTTVKTVASGKSRYVPRMDNQVKSSSTKKSQKLKGSNVYVVSNKGKNAKDFEKYIREYKDGKS
ncbi:MAG: hypothetical protein HRS57_00265 [Mycoplasmataceae bacterium]|nr:hypothetical protein [Mycoplasmataceae bacterium]